MKTDIRRSSIGTIEVDQMEALYLSKLFTKWHLKNQGVYCTGMRMSKFLFFTVTVKCYCQQDRVLLLCKTILIHLTM